jgi:aspartate ammonia-lyase
MRSADDVAATMADRLGIAPADLALLAAHAEPRRYEPGSWLFHESAPRQWLGLVDEGEIEIVRGLHGDERVVAVLGAGSLVSEGALLDTGPHAASARTRTGATVWTIARVHFEQVRAEHPEAFYRVLGRVAAVVSERLRLAASQIAGRPAHTVVGGFRREHDLLGERDVPEHAYWGVQTLRAVENFAISGIPLSQFGHLVTALAYVKKAAALANTDLGVLDPTKATAIAAACDEIAGGKLRDQFVVDMVQGGAGTSTNMNANEVITNRALELMGHTKGRYDLLHPNDDTNCSQSTNDVYPTAVKLGVLLALHDTVVALHELERALRDKGREFHDVIKMGRTQMQDAVPMTLGQEFSAYAVMVGEAGRKLRECADELHEVSMGATAIGTGINSPPGYAEVVTRKLTDVSGFPLRLSADLVEATQDSGAFVQLSGTLKRAAVQISKICNDLRLLSSGPRAGLGEIRLPAMQPGSTIMPGKVNPVIPEVVNQVCFQIIGHDMTITMAAEASQLELNMAEPIITFDLLWGLMLLKNAALTLTSRCIVGIEADRAACRSAVERSIGLVTALNPVIGYARSVEVARDALDTGRPVAELVLERGWLTADQLAELLRPEAMTRPRRIG